MPSHPSHDIPIWTLTKDAKVASAVLRYVEGYGYEARLLFNGEFRQGRAFRGETEGGAAARIWAEEWREELQGRGWQPVNDAGKHPRAGTDPPH